MTDSLAFAQSAEKLWPLSYAEEWDAPGFSVHMPSEISRVLLSVDITGAVVAEAAQKGCQLVLSHHPFLLRGTSNVNFDDLKGSVLQAAVSAGISLYSAHTNADVVERGVSDTLARGLGLRDVMPLSATDESDTGHGRLGRLEQEVSLKEFAAKLAELLPFSPRGVQVAGDPDQIVSTVALCGGAGDSFIHDAFESGADVYITSDLRHHVTLDAISRPRHSAFACIDVSHWAAESLWLSVAASQLSAQLEDVEFVLSEIVTDPWVFSINRGNQ
jgi:dinuclear metal center YbgI/SA1388 family protein